MACLLIIIICALLASATAQCVLPGGDATDCGKRTNREFSVDGEKVKSDQPWLIGIYVRSTPTSTDWKFQTTGTLLSPTHIVTGAFSVSMTDGRRIPASHLRLIAGKHLQNFEITEPNSQTRDVKSVRRHEKYSNTSRVHNLALIVPATPFKLTADVNIACVDWSGLLPAPTQGQSVTISGVRRGVTTKSKVFAAQPAVFVSIEQCKASAIEERRRFVSLTNLCSKTTGSNFCDVIYGSGLFVERATARGPRVFILGVQKNDVAWTQSGSCYLNMYTSFASVYHNLKMNNIDLS